MSEDKTKVYGGLNIEEGDAGTVQGDLRVDSSGNLQFHDATSEKAVATSGDISTHAALTTSHGVSGDIVGTTDTQTLTNKTLTSPVLNTGVSGTAVKDEDNMASDSATHLATQQSIKAYVDAQVTAQDLDTAGDTGTGAIDLDSQSLTIAGGTGLDSVASAQTITLNIDSTVATLSGSQSLTNKTIGDSNTINAQDDAFTIDDAVDSTKQIDFDAAGSTSTKTTITSSQTTNRVVTIPDATDTLVGKATTDTLTNKTLTSPVLNTGVSGTAVKDEDDMTSDSATHLATQQSIKAYVDAEIGALSSAPAGAIIAYGGTSAPSGYLLCDGSSVSRTTYSDLFAAISTAYGTVDGSNFNVPDLRGKFARGTDNAAGNDPDAAGRTAAATGGNTGDNVGSIQADAFDSHTHAAGGAGSQEFIYNRGSSGAYAALAGGSVFDRTTAPVVSTGGNETRPLNVNVNYIIKT